MTNSPVVTKSVWELERRGFECSFVCSSFLRYFHQSYIHLVHATINHFQLNLSQWSLQLQVNWFVIRLTLNLLQKQYFNNKDIKVSYHRSVNTIPILKSLTNLSSATRSQREFKYCIIRLKRTSQSLCASLATFTREMPLAALENLFVAVRWNESKYCTLELFESVSSLRDDTRLSLSSITYFDCILWKK